MSASLVLNATRVARFPATFSTVPYAIGGNGMRCQLRYFSINRLRCTTGLERSCDVVRWRTGAASLSGIGTFGCQRATSTASATPRESGDSTKAPQRQLFRKVVTRERRPARGTQAEEQKGPPGFKYGQNKLEMKAPQRQLFRKSAPVKRGQARGTLIKGQTQRPGSERDGEESETVQSPALNKAVQLELQWLPDRVALAQRVDQILKTNDLTKARALVIAAQKRGMDTVVSWNMIINYNMVMVGHKAAFKVYNDMKKRGCRPSNQTYTILLRGLTNRYHPKAVEVALAIYDSLWSIHLRKTPSTMHSNAVLGVCSRYFNLEALWEVAGRLPERGFGSPDGRTFTIILNAIRYSTEHEIEKLDESTPQSVVLEKKAAAVREGKKIWAEVLFNWRGGRFDIDRPLVSAMGSLLLFGGREREMDLRDLFLLLNQTMAIPLLDSRLQRPSEPKDQDNEAAVEPEWPGDFADLQDSVDVQVTRFEGPQKKKLDAAETAAQDEEAEFRYLFSPVSRPSYLKDTSFPKFGSPQPTNDNELIMQPTNAELTFILEACLKMPQAIRLGKQYWSCLRSPPFDISPDRESLRRYLDLLCSSRASAEVLRILQEEIENGIVTKLSFNIAMLTCQRDIKNPNIFRIATQLLDLLRDKFTISARRTVDLYLEIVSYAYRKDPKSATASIQGDSARETSKSFEDLQKDVLTTAVTHIQPHIRRLIDSMSSEKAKRLNTDENFTQTVATLSSIKALYDRLLAPEYRSMISAEEAASYKDQVKTLGLYCKNLGGMLNESPEQEDAT